MKYSEKWGDSIESAVELALQDLKLTRDKVTVTVLEEPSKGFFGIGSRLAKVRVEEIKVEEVKEIKEEKSLKSDVLKALEKFENESAEEEVIQTRPGNKEVAAKLNKNNNKKNKKKNRPKREFKIEGEKEQVSVKPEDLVVQDDHPVKEFLENMIKEMGLELNVSVSANESSVYVDIEGKDTGSIIGKRGQTLDAVQYLSSLVVNKGEDEYIRVIVDAEGYRAKREDALEKLAYRLAEKVVKTGKSVRLEAMNPYERKIIHTTLQTVPAVRTKSEGSEPHRRVVIEPAKN